MTDISLDGLERLIEKGRELKKLLQENPEILEYMRLWNIVNKVDTKLRKKMEVCRFKIIGRKKIIA